MPRCGRALASLGLGLGLCWLGLFWGAPADANPDTAAKDYLLTQPGAGRPTGARLQIGTGLPLPVGPDGIFTGGKMTMTGVITTRKGGGMMTTTGPAIWPPLLLIGPNPAAVTTGAPTAGKRIRQTAGTAQGGAIKIPTTVLSNSNGGVPRHGGVFNTNPTVYDVATTISYAWPTTAATLSPGGGPAPAVGVFTAMGPGGGTIAYSRPGGVGKSFGGAALFAIVPGPSAGTRLLPANGAGMLPIATVFFNAAFATPGMAAFLGVIGASTAGMGQAAQGASLAAPSFTTMFGAVPGGLHPVNAGGPPCTMWCLGANGTIMGLPMDPTTITTWSVGPGFGTQTHNNATSEGFPWTTGFITVYAPGALGGETFFLVGSDGRGSGAGTTGVGNLSLVSGSLSSRNLSKANANRGFLSLNLPEPAAALGAVGALGMLALCHGLARRRPQPRGRQPVVPAGN